MGKFYFFCIVEKFSCIIFLLFLSTLYYQFLFDIFSLQTLLRYGAIIPDPESAESQRTEKHTLQHSVGTLNVYRALASEFYISLTSLDPIGTAFTLSDKLKEMSDQEYEFRAEYIEISNSTEQYAADMLGQARDSDEVCIKIIHIKS